MLNRDKASPTFDLVFLFFSLISGFLLMLLAPPFQAADEPAHFFKSFHVSEGKVFGVVSGTTRGDYLPVPLINVSNTEGISFHPEVKMTKEIWLRKRDPIFMRWDSNVPRKYQAFTNTVLYWPLSYLPQAIAIFLGRLCHVGPLGLLYLARLAVLVSSCLLAAAAVAKLPCYRGSFQLALLCPMSLQLFGSAALDGLLISGAFFLAAATLRGLLQPMTRKETFFFFLVAAHVSLAKLAYAPLALFFCLLLALNNRRLRFALSSVLICVLLPLLWGWLTSRNFVSHRQDSPVNPGLQLLFVIRDPRGFFALFVLSLKAQIGQLYEWCVGTLGWLDTRLPSWFYPFYGVALTLTVLLESSKAMLRFSQKAGAAFTFIACVCFSYLLMYLSWAPPGSRALIEGVQGRYFIPLMPALILSSPRFHLHFPRVALMIANLTTLMGALVAASAIYKRYYVY